jgi:biuret amidohydrolase
VPLDLPALVAAGHTALVTQECQRGVVGDDAALPELAAVARDGMLERIAELAAAARSAGVPVLHCVAMTRADGLGANRNARLFAAMAKSPVRQIEGTAAVEVVPEIGVDERDMVLRRYHGLSPMTDTGLDPVLRNLGVTTIVGVGVSLNVAIPNFAFDAVNRGYQFVIPSDAVAGVPADYGEAVLRHSLSVVATVVTAADVIAAWSA